MKTSSQTPIWVGGSHGYVRYEDVTHEDAREYLDHARRWLGVEVRHDITHW